MQFEADIHDCIVGGANSASLSWTFKYASNTRTKPDSVTYSVSYSNYCSATSATFTNVL